MAKKVARSPKGPPKQEVSATSPAQIAALSVCARHDNKPDELLEIFHELQHELGHVPEETLPVIAKGLLLRRLGPAAEPYQKGRAGTMMEAGEVLTAAGLAGAVLAGRSRAAAALSGAALMAASALTRFGVFEAGRASARDPKYTVGPQRQRLREQGEPAS